MKIKFKDVDGYLALQTEESRLALEKLRKVIKATAPDAEETIGYNMPMYKYHGMLVAFAAAKNHCGFYPCSGSTVEHFKDELKTFSTSPGTIRFTLDKPIPVALIKKIVKLRMQQNADKKKTKTTSKK
jgi:uncharacterized protein YdhG (YjbR/CyaY superfamily)